MKINKQENLALFIKKRLFKLCICYAALLILCVLAIALTVAFHEEKWVFFVSVFALVASLAVCKRVKSSTHIYPFSRYAYGKLLKVEAEDKRVDTLKVGGVGFGQRKYDSFKKQIINGHFYIQEENGKIKVIRANGLSEKQLAYFSSGEPVVKYRGAKFPLTLDNGEREEMLCSVCGSFFQKDCEACPDCHAPAK